MEYSILEPRIVSSLEQPHGKSKERTGACGSLLDVLEHPYQRIEGRLKDHLRVSVLNYF